MFHALFSHGATASAVCSAPGRGRSLLEPSALDRLQILDPPKEGAAEATDVVVAVDVGTAGAQPGSEGGRGFLPTLLRVS